MQRYFLRDATIGTDKTVKVCGSDAHHMLRVMRMRPGDRVQVILGDQGYIAELLDGANECVRLLLGESLDERREAALELTLLQGLPKGDKMDAIVRQVCEIGVSRIFIYEGIRSVAAIPIDKRERRLERLRAVAKEAAEQAQRERIPDIQYFPNLETAVDSLGQGVPLLTPYESQTVRLPPLKAVLRDLPIGSTVAFAIGPEGGFDDREVAFVQSRGARLLTLGPRILRTETAGLVVAAALLYEFDQMGVV